MNKIVVEYTHSRWKSPTNNWGVYFGKIKKIFSKDDDFNLNEGSEVCFVGDAGFELKFKQLYSMTGEFIKSQYGMQLQLGTLSEYLDMTSQVDKDNFLKAILTGKQFDDLKSKFKDPFILLENNEREKLLSVNGIGEVVVDRLLKKFNNTRDNAHVYAYFIGLGLTNDFINKLIITYGGGDTLLQKFKQNPYVLINDVDGVGFLKADEIAMKSKLVEPDSSERVFAATEYFLSNKLNNSTYIEMNKFKAGINGLLKNKLSSKLLDELIIDMYDKNIIYLDKDKKIIALMRLYMLEKNIASELKRIIESEPIIKLNIDITKEEIEEKISLIEKEQGWEYTDEQVRAIKQCFLKNINIIYALAGTGKTTVVNAIIKIINGKYPITQVALAGKAAQRLEEVTNYPASTIHRALGFVPELGFTYHSRNPMITSLVVIDESSMLSLDLFYSFVSAIPDGCKLIILGDTGQLESIGVGNLLKDLIESNKIPKVELTKIHRQAQKSAIITNSIDIRNSKLIIEKDFIGYDIKGELQDLELEITSHGKNTINDIMKYFKKYYNQKENNILEIQVVLPKKDDALLVNNEIQNFVNPVADEKVSFSKKFEIRVGDKVINRKNNYNSRTIKGVKTPIFNGNIGIVNKIDFFDKILIIDFENIGEIIFDFEDGGNLQLGYAITCHSAQGSQWKTVIVGINYSMFFLLSREWLYTALTRASKHCVLVAENQALRYATGISKINKKNTFLKKIL